MQSNSKLLLFDIGYKENEKRESNLSSWQKKFNENILFLFKISSVRENMLLYQGHEIFNSCQQIIHLKKCTWSIDLPVRSPLWKQLCWIIKSSSEASSCPLPWLLFPIWFVKHTSEFSSGQGVIRKEAWTVTNKSQASLSKLRDFKSAMKSMPSSESIFFFLFVCLVLVCVLCNTWTKMPGVQGHVHPHVEPGCVGAPAPSCSSGCSSAARHNGTFSASFFSFQWAPLWASQVPDGISVLNRPCQKHV